MSKAEMLRCLVSERLTAAAEEIFALFERTISEYEEELCRSKEENERKQQLLDSVLSPQVLLHREVRGSQSTWREPTVTRGRHTDSTQREWRKAGPRIEPMISLLGGESTNRVQTETERQDKPYIIKEEPKEMSITLESNYQPLQCQYIPVNVKNENEEAKSLLLQEREDNDDWSQPWEPPASSSTQADGGDYNREQINDKRALRHSKLIKLGANGEEFLRGLRVKNKRQKCPICGKKFKSDLWSHMLVHTDERPFSCSVCNKGFTRKSSLTLHKALHMREKPFSCPVCKKGFNQKSHLKSHMPTHTKPFVGLRQYLDLEIDKYSQPSSSSQNLEIQGDVEEYSQVQAKDLNHSGVSQNSSPSMKSRSINLSVKADWSL